VVIETGGLRFMTDPVLRDRIGFVRRRDGGVPSGLPQPDAVLVSHLHHDHLDLHSLRRLDRRATVVLPRGAGRLVRAEGFADVREVVAGDRLTLGRVVVEAVPALHAGSRLPFGPRAAALGYTIDADHRIYFAGDTDVFPAMARLGTGLDLAILPVGGWGPTLRGGHMDPDRAAEALALLNPRYAIAIHWGTLWPIGLGSVRPDRFLDPGPRFGRMAARVAPNVSVVHLDPGDELLLTADRGVPIRHASRV
jgi:L-ascorbate metabolism protein UlaG (beta-lactamase superfamily)